MLATFFEWRIHEGKEQQFRDGWDAVTRMLHQDGSYGSSLFTNAAGHYCAFAIWPDKQTRDRAFAPYLEKPTDQHLLVREAIAEEIQRMDLDCVNDLWRLPNSQA